ncbi:SDR family NAD(P)-dependent oxidoreductase [Roseococcus sp. YIM B11640]|uniref:SDR family NAD(P)-dependent oxidoreductase n=1 Tax=Roseococcus sp. YIM B11640 TaxID=3133973 RepID=UPI003C7AF190
MATEAIVVGVGAGQGLGAALCRRFAREGHRVLAAGRSRERLEAVVSDIRQAGGEAEAVVADATHSLDILNLFERAADPELVVYNVGNNVRAPFRELSVETFEEAWRVNALGGFVVGREAARVLVPKGRGTLIFTGATASLRGAAQFAAFASAKAALRAVAQSAARELGPLGLHVAHVVVDGGIDGERLRARRPQRVAEAGQDGLLNIDAIADAYWHIHCQPRSAWTFELDLRPYKEPF